MKAQVPVWSIMRVSPDTTADGTDETQSQQQQK